MNKSGKNVWIETIIGACTGKWKEGNTRYFLKETFNDLLQKSQEKILSSKVCTEFTVTIILYDATDFPMDSAINHTVP